jgi:NDP-sugar pyrophosphorylase family protein
MCVRAYATQIPYGVVEEEDGEFRSIVEKPTLTHLACAGIYALSPGALSLVPHLQYMDMPALFQALVSPARRIRVHRIDSHWIDIGRHDDLERAQLEFGKLTQ